MKHFFLAQLLFLTLFLTFFTVKSQNPKITEDYLYNLIENYKKKETKQFPKGRYLIITPVEYENMLEYFANYKRNIGFDVSIVNTNTTGKTPSDIKKFIQSQYNNASTMPTFILLVGDVNSIPAYEGNPTGKIKTNPISDLEYVLLSGNDYFADVNLGRFSVENVEQLKNIINKTIFMEVNLHLFEKKAVFIAGDEKKGVWNRYYMTNSFKKGHRYVIENSFISLGYRCTELFKPDLKSVMNALNNNPLFYLYAGHGNFTLFAGKSFDLGSREVYSAFNTIFPFVFSFACKTGNFAQTCIGEHFIRANNRGAVAFLGCSVNSQTNTDKTIEKKIFGDAFKDERYLSSMINLGMKRFATTAGPLKKIREIFLKAYNLLGDPSFDLKGVFAATIHNDTITNPALFSVFSNPLDDTFSLVYTLETESFVQIDICASSGESLKNILQLTPQKQGCYYLNFSLTDLSSGLYELVLKDASRTITTPIIKR